MTGDIMPRRGCLLIILTSSYMKNLNPIGYKIIPGVPE